jgi:hypothetical protein
MWLTKETVRVRKLIFSCQLECFFFWRHHSCLGSKLYLISTQLDFSSAERDSIKSCTFLPLAARRRSSFLPSTAIYFASASSRLLIRMAFNPSKSSPSQPSLSDNTSALPTAELAPPPSSSTRAAANDDEQVSCRAPLPSSVAHLADRPSPVLCR